MSGRGIMKDRPRCKTGIEGLDKELNGGIPLGNTILMCGGSGVGRSGRMLYQYLGSSFSSNSYLL